MRRPMGRELVKAYREGTCDGLWGENVRRSIGREHVTAYREGTCEGLLGGNM